MLCEHKCEFNKDVTPDYGTVIKRVRQKTMLNATSVKLVAYLHMHIFRKPRRSTGMKVGTSCAFVVCNTQKPASINTTWVIHVSDGHGEWGSYDGFTFNWLVRPLWHEQCAGVNVRCQTSRLHWTGRLASKYPDLNSMWIVGALQQMVYRHKISDIDQLKAVGLS